MASGQDDRAIRYEPEDRPPALVTAGVGLQAAMTIIAPVALTVVIVARIAGQPESYVSWGVVAALMVSGVATILQAVRLGRIGSGHVLAMGTSGAFIAVCVAALDAGGPSLMASLVVVSSLCQFMLAARLSLLRRVFTPVVSGTVVMLIAVTVAPLLFDTMGNVPDGTARAAAPVAALATVVAVAALVLRGSPSVRLWSPVVGIAVGCAVAAPFGIYDTNSIVAAPWIGFPVGAWPGFDLSFDADFWALLLPFVVVTIVGAVETVGDGIAIQQVSRRNPRATDFRVVQGALNADGAGNLLSGIAGTLPNTTYSSSLALAEVTGVAARRVGVVIGGVFIAVAFFPKVSALLIAIPGPVAAGYLIVLIGLLFVQGMRLVLRDGLNHRNAAVVGVSFWLGVGFQNRLIFPDILGDGFVGVLLENGMTAGTISAVVMVVFMDLTGSRRRRLRVPLDGAALPHVREFLGAFASRARWSETATGRLTAAGEEALAVLQQEDVDHSEDARRRLAVVARIEGASAVVEFVTVLQGQNLEDHLAYLSELPPAPDESEVSFRLLRHYASTVRHQKYHGVDILELTVDRGH